MDMLQSFMSKLYWPVFIILCIVLIALIFLYATQIDNWSDRRYYHWMNIKRIGALVAVLAGSYYMRNIGNQKIANIILYIPVAITIILVIGFFVMVFLFSNASK